MLRRMREGVVAHPGLLGAALVLVAVGFWFVLFPADSSVSSDDGAYVITAHALSAGEWSVPHVLATRDPAGLSYPYQNSTITQQGFFPGVRHPAWVIALTPMLVAGGPLGLHLLPAVGLAVAVGSTAALSSAMGHRSTALLATALALFSPLLFNALQLWAHAPVAGGVALAMVGAVRITDGAAVSRSVPLFLLGLVVASALRADGLIFAAAVAGVVLLTGLRSRRPSTVLIGAIGGLASLATYGAFAAFARSVTGSAAAVGAAQSRGGGTADSWLGGRLRGVVHTAFSINDTDGAFMLVLFAFALTAVGVVRLRRQDSEAAVALFLAATVVWLFRIAAFPREMASGLLGAWPVVLFAIVRPWRSLRPSEQRVIGMLVLALVGVAATQYDDGGGLNWGGRFLAPAIPALSVFVATGLRTAVAGLPSLRPPAVAVAGLVVTTLAASLVADGSIRSRHDQVITRLPEAADQLVVTSSPSLPRLAWRTFPETQWLRIPRDDEGASRLKHWLRQEGFDEIVLFQVGMEDAETIAGVELYFEDTNHPRRVQIGD